MERQALKCRLISLINTIGKLFEALIRERLEKEIDEKSGLSEYQYDSRRRRATLYAV